MCKVIAVANQKGGCSKTSVVANLGIGLALQGKRVCLIDADPQGSLTVALGFPDPDEIPYTLATVMRNIIDEKEFPPDYAMLHHMEGIDLIPANMDLSGIEPPGRRRREYSRHSDPVHRFARVRRRSRNRVQFDGSLHRLVLAE